MGTAFIKYSNYYHVLTCTTKCHSERLHVGHYKYTTLYVFIDVPAVLRQIQTLRDLETQIET